MHDIFGGPFATAVVIEVVRHIFARHFFAITAGIALWHIVANMRDFVAHKLCALRLVVDKFLKFSHKLPTSNKINLLYNTYVNHFNMRFRQKPTRKSTICVFCIIKISLKTNDGNKEKRIAQLRKTSGGSC